jgi:DNA-binding CsgD family transcriptional regulator
VHEPNSCEQLAVLLAEAAEAGVEHADLELVRQLLATPTANQLAAVLQITPRTIRNRRDRITSKLRAVALAA